MTQGDEDAVPLVLELRAYVRCVEEKQIDGLKGAAALMGQAADAIETLSIPQGLGEEEVDRAAKGLFEDWVAEDFNEEYCSWEQLPDKVTWRRRARAALTSARAQ